MPEEKTSETRSEKGAGLFRSGLVKTAIGFLLTSLVGAFIGSWFQYRLWSQQHNTEILEKYRAEATDVFKTTSAQIDRRYYNLDKLFQMMQQQKDTGTVHRQWEIYQKYSGEYHNQRNQTRALIDWYFGKSIREEFAPSLFNELNAVEAKMDTAYDLYMTWKGVQNPALEASIPPALSQLSLDVYTINLNMITAIKEGRVGAFCDDRDEIKK